MILKIWNCRVPKYMFYRQCVTSLLYVAGDKKSQQVSILTPYLDFDSRFTNITELEKNIKVRKLNVNVKKIHELWKIMQQERENKSILEKHRSEILEKVKEFENSGDQEEVKKFKHQGIMLREELKSHSRVLWQLEEKTITKALNLPNDLHPDTPHGTEKLMYENKELVNDCNENHIKIAEKFDLIVWRNSSNFYLLNNAAVYEMQVVDLVSELLKIGQFIQVSNSDLVRSVVLEGCGMSYKEPNAFFLIKKNDDSSDPNCLHLVGSASLPSFCCLHSKQFVSLDSLPIRYFCIGRQYNPPITVKGKGLFSSSQETSIGIFVAASSQSAMMSEFNEIVDFTTAFYKRFKYSFKVVYAPAHELEMYESLRVSFQMYSPYLKTYIELGKISVSGSFISKRLLMCYENNNEYDFMYIISGSVVSISKLIGCAIENDYSRNEELLIPNRI